MGDDEKYHEAMIKKVEAEARWLNAQAHKLEIENEGNS